MPREHLLVGTGEETIHDNQIVIETKKDKRKNWWYYHKIQLLIILIGIALVFSFVYSIVTKVSPDYQIGMITSYTLSDGIIESLQDYIAEYADDLNGDGQVVVQINQYTLSSDENLDYNTLQASVVRFTADASSADSIIYFHDADGLAYFTEDTLSGFFSYTDGTAMPEGATDFENAMYSWSEISALEQYQPPTLEDDYMASELSSEDIKALLERYRISIRSLSENISKDDNKESYYKDNLDFFERLKMNQKIER